MKTTSEDLEEHELVDLDEDDTEQNWYPIDSYQYWDLLEKQKKTIDMIVKKAKQAGRSTEQVDRLRQINRNFMEEYHALVRKHYID